MSFRLTPDIVSRSTICAKRTCCLAAEFVGLDGQSKLSPEVCRGSFWSGFGEDNSAMSSFGKEVSEYMGCLHKKHHV